MTAVALVDVHAHFLPPVYREALAGAGIDRPDGMPAVPDWSPGAHVEVLDRNGIDRAVLSISSPGVDLDGSRPAAIDLARAVNDAAARAVAEHPDRFAAFASLPLPWVDDALAEVERALDDRDLCGVNVLSNLGGTYLGHPSFEPLWTELDRRAAVVFVHPTSPTCWGEVSLDRPRPMLEFPFDTTRTVTDLIFSGVLDRHRSIRWIIPHAGGTLPFLAARIAGMARLVDPSGAVSPDVVLGHLAGLHYDLAGSANPTSVAALLDLVDRSQVLYGSDWPFTPEPGVERGLRWIRGDGNPVAADELGANAERLLSLGGPGGGPPPSDGTGRGG